MTPDSHEHLVLPIDCRLLGDRENDIILPQLLDPTQHLAVAAQDTRAGWRDDRAETEGQAWILMLGGAGKMLLLLVLRLAWESEAWAQVRALPPIWVPASGRVLLDLFPQLQNYVPNLGTYVPIVFIFIKQASFIIKCNNSTKLSIIVIIITAYPKGFQSLGQTAAS